MMLSYEAFHTKFLVIPNNADGNCLFESMETLLFGSPYEAEHGYTTAMAIREIVSEFYRNFDKDIEYPETSIAYKIKLCNLFDNVDEEMAHDYNIWNDKVWVSFTDVFIWFLLFEVSIYMYTYMDETNT